MTDNPWGQIRNVKADRPMTLVIHNLKLGTLSAAARDYLGRGRRVKFERNLRGGYSIRGVNRGGLAVNAKGGVYLTDLRDLISDAIRDDEVLVYELTPNTEYGKRLVFSNVTRRPKEHHERAS